MCRLRLHVWKQVRARRDPASAEGSLEVETPTDPVPAAPVLLCERCEARRRQFPETSPDYLIEELIGEGGMGQVYRARQISRNRRVAIKMMLANSTAGDKAVNYFHREIQALRDMLMPSGKCHPSIVEFYDLFQVEGHLQLVMEYVDGKNALEWVRSLKEPLPIESAPGSARPCSRRWRMPIPGATFTATSSRRTCW